jgi:hypothetical protein
MYFTALMKSLRGKPVCALHTDAVDIDSRPTKLKLFGRDSDQEIQRGEYFESFLNVDIPSGLVFWNEKDVDYRVPLIRGISDA